MDNYQKKYKEISTSTQWNMMKENRSVASSWTQQVIFIMSEEQGVQQYVTLDHKPSLKSLGYICSNSQKYIVWVKIIDFFFMPKIIRTLSNHLFHEDILIWSTVNISKLNFWLVICIAKNFIWTTLKAIFFQYLDYFAPSDSRYSNSCISAKYCPILTNHTSMERLFIQLSNDVYISISKNLRLWLVLWSRVTYDWKASGFTGKAFRVWQRPYIYIFWWVSIWTYIPLKVFHSADFSLVISIVCNSTKQ